MLEDEIVEILEMAIESIRLVKERFSKIREPGDFVSTRFSFLPGIGKTGTSLENPACRSEDLSASGRSRYVGHRLFRLF